MIRKPIITVLGHIDAGKTKLLDSIRGTAIAEKEAGGITQHIGATEVPIKVVEKIAGPLMKKYGFELKIPGLLFIDTPGHEAFANLRKRGGSIADLAVLVVDINKGLQPQTIEAIDVLKEYKTPFVVAANKIDSVHGWIKNEGSFTDSISKQSNSVAAELDSKLYELVGQLYSHGFACERFDRIKDFTKEIAIIPVSAKFFEGIAEVLLFLAGLSQKYLGKRIDISEEEMPRGTVLEIKEEKGLGKTIDVILYEGKLSVGQDVVVGGKNGVIATKIRALLVPSHLQDLRGAAREKFEPTKEVFAAAGVKIAAPLLEDAVAGSPLLLKSDAASKEIAQEIERVKIDTDAIGPILKTDALGSLEAIVKLLEAKKIKVRKADVGAVSRRDINEAVAVKEKDEFLGVVFAFRTKINEDAKEQAEKNDVMVFEGDVIYTLIENYVLWEQKQRDMQKQKVLANIVFPSKLFVMPNHVFRNSKPAIVGVKIEQGRLKNNVQLMKEDGKIIGTIDSIEHNGKSLQEAKPQMEVAVSISGATFGKSFKENDELYSFIPKRHLQSLEGIKNSLNEEELDLLEKIKLLEKKELGLEEE